MVIFGAGTAGIGIADQIRGAMVREGLSPEGAIGRFWCVDRHGLITSDMTEHVGEYQAMYARPAGWKGAAPGTGWSCPETLLARVDAAHRARPPAGFA